MDQLTSSGSIVLLQCASAAVLPSVLHYVTNDIVKFLNVTSCSTAFGTQVWVGSIAGLTMFRTLKRRTFGKVQSKLFPKYAILNTSCSLMALVTYLHLNNIRPTDGFSKICGKWEGLMLTYNLLSNVANSLYFIPATTNLMFQIHARENALGLEDEVGQTSPLKRSDKSTDEDKNILKKFNINHGISMLMSLVSMGTCGAYLYFIAKGMTF